MKTKLQISAVAFLGAFLIYLLIFFGGNAVGIHPLIRYELAFVAYFLFVYFLIKKSTTGIKTVYILLWTLLGAVIFALPHALTHLPFHLITLTAIFTYCLGSVMGFFFANAKEKIAQVIILLISVIYCIFYALIYNDLFEYFTQFWYK